VRILAIDIGTGTQDVLLWESGVAVENLVQMVMPSPTVLVERRVRAATRAHGLVALAALLRCAARRHDARGLLRSATCGHSACSGVAQGD
jgi:uncharacterized protein (DUF1786 family)